MLRVRHPRFLSCIEIRRLLWRASDLVVVHQWLVGFAVLPVRLPAFADRGGATGGRR
jgi:hypothetical protein